MIEASSGDPPRQASKPAPPGAGDRGFSLTRGGPWYELLRRAHLVDGRGVRWMTLVALGWVPLVVAGLTRLALGVPLDPILRDPAVHVRMLISFPLLIAAERVLDERVDRSLQVVRLNRLADPTALDGILARVARLRDAWFPEVAIALAALVGGQLMIWAIGERSSTFESHWLAIVVLPAYQFLLARWLWRWALWSYALARLAKLPLATNALHPDAAAGLKILSVPIGAFAVFTGSLACVISAAWTTKVVHGASAKAFVPTFLLFVIIATATAVLPVVVFVRQLVRARNRDLHAHHVLANEYVREFRRRWMRERRPPQLELLGASDFQSLADLANAYRVTETTRFIPLETRAVLMVWFAAFAPMLPLVFAVMPLPELADRLAKLLLGGV